jgi:LmbE family N-acetylglucosaminyl deacetylase
MRILAVVAHPDDEVLSCGGTLARLAQEGHQVGVTILGVRHLQQEAEQAAKALGIGYIQAPTVLPDNRFDAVDLLYLVMGVEAVLTAVAPEVVYTHHRDDLNLDHRLTCQAVLTATRPQPGCSVKDVYMGEVPSSTEWGFTYQFKPNVFVDITAQINRKIDAMAIYAGELRPPPHPRSIELLPIRARQWGSVVGLLYAEPFELVRSVR